MTEMPQEDMEDASTPEGDHRAEDKRSLRTFAYTASAVVLLVSVFVLVSLLLADLQDLREELAMEMAEVTHVASASDWARTNDLVGKTFTCLLLPLLVLLPPVFAGRRVRLAATMVLCAVGLLLLLLHLISAVGWVATSPDPLPRLSMLLQRGAVAVLLTLPLALLLATTTGTWRQARPSTHCFIPLMVTAVTKKF